MPDLSMLVLSTLVLSMQILSPLVLSMSLLSPQWRIPCLMKTSHHSRFLPRDCWKCDEKWSLYWSSLCFIPYPPIVTTHLPKPTFLTTHLPSCPPPFLHTSVPAPLPSCPPPFLPTSLSAHLPSCPPPFLPTSLLQRLTHVLFTV